MVGWQRGWRAFWFVYDNVSRIKQKADKAIKVTVYFLDTPEKLDSFSSAY